MRPANPPTNCLAAVLTVAIAIAVPQASAVCDTSPPESTAVTLSPPSVDVSAGDVPVTCSITVRDQITGVESVTCHVRSWGDPRGVRSCSAAVPSSGDRNDGVFSCSLTVPRFAPSGAWPVWVDLTDRAGQRVTNLPSSTRLQVTSTPGDLVAPNITGLLLSPSVFDTSGADRTLTCTMSLADLVSGSSWARCSVWSPPGLVSPFQLQHACETTSLISGTVHAGSYRCTITLPRSSPAGTWLVRVDVADRAENEAFYSDVALTSRGLPSTVSISSAPHDLTPPQLVALDLDQNHGDTSAAPAITTCRVHASDDLSGVTRLRCRLSSENGFGSSACESTVPTSGSPLDGLFECALPLPTLAPAGRWTVALELLDRVGNTFRSPAAGLDTLQFDSEFANFCGGPVDPILRFRAGSTSDLRFTRLDGAAVFDIYRGLAAGLVDVNHDGLADDYGQCRNHLDPDVTDGGFTDADLPTTVERAFTYLIGWRDGLVDHGTGRTSAGLLRNPQPSCP